LHQAAHHSSLLDVLDCRTLTSASAAKDFKIRVVVEMPENAARCKTMMGYVGKQQAARPHRQSRYQFGDGKPKTPLVDSTVKGFSKPARLGPPLLGKFLDFARDDKIELNPSFSK
jgi:hypothetical protein